MLPNTLTSAPHNFLHWIKTSGVKIRLALNKSYLFHELEGHEKLILQKKYIITWKKIKAINFFSKHSIADVWQGSEYASSSDYPRILNMSLVLNVPKFWINQGSEFASGFECVLVLNGVGCHESWDTFLVFWCFVFSKSIK